MMQDWYYVERLTGQQCPLNIFSNVSLMLYIVFTAFYLKVILHFTSLFSSKSKEWLRSCTQSRLEAEAKGTSETGVYP